MRWFAGLMLWWVILYLTLSATGWGPGDPGYWGAIILGFPLGMLAAAFIPPKRNGK